MATSEHVAALQAMMAEAAGGGRSRAFPPAHSIAATGQHQPPPHSHLQAPSKRKRANRKDKGLDAFRHALMQHLEQHARLSPATNSNQLASSVASPASPPECKQGDSADSVTTSAMGDRGGLHAVAAAAGAAASGVSDSQRAAWLREYEARIAEFSIKQLVQESVRFRFQCSPFIILVPNWHALREALWLFLKQIGVKKAKRSVSTKKDLIDICIQPEVQFDFSEFVKDAESHGNRKEKGPPEEMIAPSSARPAKKRVKREHVAIKHEAAAEDDSMPTAAAAAAHEHELEVDIENDGASTGGESAGSSMHMQPSPAGSPAVATRSLAMTTRQHHQQQQQRQQQHASFESLHSNGVAMHHSSNGGKPSYSYAPSMAPAPSGQSNGPSHSRTPSLPHGLSHGQSSSSIVAPLPPLSGPGVTTAHEVIHHFLNLSPSEYHQFKTWFYINVVQRENPNMHITINNHGSQQHHPPSLNAQHTQQTFQHAHLTQQHQQQQQAQPAQQHMQHHHPSSSSMAHHSSHGQQQQHGVSAMLHSLPSTPLLSSSLIPPLTPAQYPLGNASSDAGVNLQQGQQHGGSAVQAFHVWSNNVLMTPMMGPTGATPMLQPTAQAHTPSSATHAALVHGLVASPVVQPSSSLLSPTSAGIFQSPPLRGHELGAQTQPNVSSMATAAKLAAQQAAQTSSHRARLEQQLALQQKQLEKLAKQQAADGKAGSDDEDEDSDESDDDEDGEEDGEGAGSGDLSDPHLAKRALGANGGMQHVASPLMPPPTHHLHSHSHNTGPGSSPLIKRTIDLSNLAHSHGLHHAHGHIHMHASNPPSPFPASAASPSLRALYRATATANATSGSASAAAVASSAAAVGMAALSQGNPLSPSHAASFASGGLLAPTAQHQFMHPSSSEE